MYTTVLCHLWLVKYMDFQLHRELVPLKHTHVHVQVLCSVKVQGLKCEGKEECAMRYKRKEFTGVLGRSLRRCCPCFHVEVRTDI